MARRTKALTQHQLRAIKQRQRQAKADRRQATTKIPRSAFTESFEVYQDYYGKTCITIARANHSVRFIPLDTDTLRVQQRGAESFLRDWQSINDYPVDRAAVIYCAHAREFGANEEAWRWLQQIISRVNVQGETLPVYREDDEMAAPQKPLRDAKFQEELQGATRAPRGQQMSAATPPAPAPTRRRAVAPTAVNGATAPKERTPRAPSAASRFKELIMGTDVKNAQSFGWTDDEIFAQIQQEFDLPDERRNYVAWYRNDLKKKGETPPEAIKAEKAAPAEVLAPRTRAPRQPKAAAMPAPVTPARAPRAPRRVTS